jgi:hypothetical protein
VADGFAALDAHIARLGGLQTFVRDAAPDCADACRTDLERTIKAGTTADGRAWKPKKEGDGKPLANAAAALVVVPIGKRIYMRLKGPEARHHLGAVKGGTVRQIIPVRTVPPSMAKVIKAVLERRFSEAMGGA